MIFDDSSLDYFTLDLKAFKLYDALGHLFFFQLYYKAHSFATNSWFFFSFHVLFFILLILLLGYLDKNKAMAICDLLTVLFPAPGRYLFNQSERAKKKTKYYFMWHTCGNYLYYNEWHINLNSTCVCQTRHHSHMNEIYFFKRNK